MTLVCEVVITLTVLYCIALHYIVLQMHCIVLFCFVLFMLTYLFITNYGVSKSDKILKCYMNLHKLDTTVCQLIYKFYFSLFTEIV